MPAWPGLEQAADCSLPLAERHPTAPNAPQPRLRPRPGALCFGYHLGVVNGPLEVLSQQLGFGGSAVLQGMVGAAAMRTAASAWCLLLMPGPTLVGQGG